MSKNRVVSSSRQDTFIGATPKFHPASNSAGISRRNLPEKGLNLVFSVIDTPSGIAQNEGILRHYVAV